MKSNRPFLADFSPDRLLPAAVFWFTAMVMEGVAGFLFYAFVKHSNQGWCAAAAICHLAAAAILLALSGYSRGGVNSIGRFRIRFYGVLVFFLPLMGLVGCLILQLVCGRWIRPRGLVEDFQAETEQRVIEPERHETQMDLKAFLDEELAVQPVMDILAGHDDNLKRGAIETLRRIGTVEAVNILKKCLSDGSPEVRYNAHAALTRLDESQTRQIKSAQQRLDAGVRQAEDLYRYGKRCAAYGESGLLDDDTQRHYFQMAREALVAANKKGLDETRLMLDLGRLEMNLGAYGDASVQFRGVLSREPGNPHALIGLAEVCYTSGDATGLKAVVEQIRDSVSVEPESVSEGILLNFWVSPQKAV